MDDGNLVGVYVSLAAAHDINAILSLCNGVAFNCQTGNELPAADDLPQIADLDAVSGDINVVLDVGIAVKLP